MTKRLVAGQVEPGMTVVTVDGNAVRLRIVKVHSRIDNGYVRLAWTVEGRKTRYNIKPASYVRVLNGATA